MDAMGLPMVCPFARRRDREPTSSAPRTCVLVKLEELDSAGRNECDRDSPLHLALVLKHHCERARTIGV